MKKKPIDFHSLYLMLTIALTGLSLGSLRFGLANAEELSEFVDSPLIDKVFPKSRLDAPLLNHEDCPSLVEKRRKQWTVRLDPSRAYLIRFDVCAPTLQLKKENPTETSERLVDL